MKLDVGVSYYSSFVTFKDNRPVWYKGRSFSEPASPNHRLESYPYRIPALRALLIIGPKAFEGGGDGYEGDKD